jgi:hypothetical protein
MRRPVVLRTVAHAQAIANRPPQCRVIECARFASLPENQLFMRRAFDVAMRLVSSLIGLAMVAGGIVWMLQGLNLAFRKGFMVGDKHWVVYGAILALIGIGQVVWTNARRP